jgi:hypothetical protein
MKGKNIIKILIPLVAIVVVIESIVLVSTLDKAGKNNTSIDSSPNELTETLSEETNIEPVADFVFETENKEMKIGKAYKVNLSLVGNIETEIGAMDIYAKYDPELLTISKLEKGTNFPKMVGKSGIDSKSGLITSIFLWDIGESYKIESKKVDSVVSFTVTPKVEGVSEIILVTGNKDEKSVTLVVDNSTAKPMAFLGNKLEINATK